VEEVSFRQLVYKLRDDGKEVHLGFFYEFPTVEEEALARTVSLIQPKTAIVLQSGQPGIAAVDPATFEQALKNELFEGPFLIVKNQTQIPF